MKAKPVLAIILFLAGVLLLWSQMPVSASPAEQVAFPSPTPGPDGRIIYMVKAGETCTEISLLYGVSVEYIRTTNLLDQNCTLRAGQALMIGIGASSGGPVTPGPSPVPTAVPPTATPSVGGSALVCVLVYDDINGDALREADSEGAIAGAAISLTSDDGTYSQTQTSVINPDATVYQGMFDTVDWDIDHIALSRKSDIIVIAPASADMIARLATGRADDLLSSIVLASEAPILVCPAMNERMWKHPATRANVEKLKEYGYKFVPPAHGELACGSEGVGRLALLGDIIACTRKFIK